MTAAETVPAETVTGLTLPYDHHDEVLARATWSRLAEPADVAAGLLTRALGPAGALDWLLDQATGPDGQLRGSLRVPDVPGPRGPQGGARAVSAWTKAAGRWAPRLEHLDIRREIDVLERLGGSLVIPGDPWWPEGLDDLDQPPHCLWVRGDPALLATTGQGSDPPGDTRPPGRQDRVPGGDGSGYALAMVGSRSSTPYGEKVAGQVAHELAARGVLIVSGGAFGIDSAVHRAALAGGATLMVSAGGVDRFCPPGNQVLQEAIAVGGAVIAEVPPGAQPGRHRFLSRNRVIAAMCEATLVVEAAWRSGALSTAFHARELDRPLGAVPGPVTSMDSAGCHRLLRAGAVCVTDADEALELLAPVGTTDPDGAKAAASDSRGGNLLDGLEPREARVLDAMPARRAAEPERIARSAGLGDKETLSALGLLELAGRVVREGRAWRRSR